MEPISAVKKEENKIQKSFHYTQSELASALRKAGIVKGDILFSHIAMLKMGVPEEMYAGKSPVDVILGAISDVLGPEGTFLTPTYSYSLCRNQIFDPQTTPSAVGIFGNKFRIMQGVKRSCEPIFSVAGIGPKVDEFFRDLPHVCFGKGCIYERLTKADAKVCNIGPDLSFITPIHYFEQCIGVPYRFLKLFTGYVRRAGKLHKEAWLYNVKALSECAAPFTERLYADALKMGLCRIAPVGWGQVTVIRFQDAFDIFKAKSKTDPWYLAKGPACDLIKQEEERVGVKKYNIKLPGNAGIEEMIRLVWNLPRDIVSDGYDAALRALAANITMIVHEYPAGKECFTWIIPEKWGCQEAYLQTLDGRQLFSYADNPLHVVRYSLPFDGEVGKEELFRHLHTHPEHPDAIPFVSKCYERDWGLCCSSKLKDSLKDADYRVVIKTDFSYSTLKVGEIVARGETEECFVLCAHLCHPCMVNDGLSGVVAGIEVMRNLLKKKNLRYTYRLLILPETVGSAAYLSHNEDLIPKMIGGIFLDILGTDHPHLLKLSLTENTQIDRCIKLVVKEHDAKTCIIGLLEDILNDERMFNAPGIGVPMLSLSRALPQVTYKGYHSSLDTPDKVNFQNLNVSCDLVLKIIDAVEQNRIPRPRFKGELFCSRFDKIEYDTMWQYILNVVFCMDGKRSVADIAERSGIGFRKTREILDILEKEGLVGWD